MTGANRLANAAPGAALGGVGAGVRAAADADADSSEGACSCGAGSIAASERGASCAAGCGRLPTGAAGRAAVAAATTAAVAGFGLALGVYSWTVIAPRKRPMSGAAKGLCAAGFRPFSSSSACSAIDAASALHSAKPAGWRGATRPAARVCSSITSDCSTRRQRANREKDRSPEGRSAAHCSRTHVSAAPSTLCTAAGSAGKPTSLAASLGCGRSPRIAFRLAPNPRPCASAPGSRAPLRRAPESAPAPLESLGFVRRNPQFPRKATVQYECGPSWRQ